MARHAFLQQARPWRCSVLTINTPNNNNNHDNITTAKSTTATAVGIHGGVGGGGSGVTASAATSSADNSTGDTMNKSTDEIVSEVKTRLFRSRVPWLLVFDNLEDHNLLNEFVPR